MLKAGELVGVFPEATISRSFELKEFKAGAARMAQAAGVPIVPTIVWGGQRIYTKGRPRDFRRRGKALTIAFGEPLTPARRDNGDAVTAELAARMGALLRQVQERYPDTPSGDDDRWWLPAAMGGTAPTPDEAAAMDAAEAEASARRRAAEGEAPAAPYGDPAPGGRRVRRGATRDRWVPAPEGPWRRGWAGRWCAGRSA